MTAKRILCRVFGLVWMQCDRRMVSIVWRGVRSSWRLEILIHFLFDTVEIRDKCNSISLELFPVHHPLSPVLYLFSSVSSFHSFSRAHLAIPSSYELRVAGKKGSFLFDDTYFLLILSDLSEFHIDGNWNSFGTVVYPSWVADSHSQISLGWFQFICCLCLQPFIKYVIFFGMLHALDILTYNRKKIIGALD